MGLFDYVRCEYPLPGNAPSFAAEADYQTKDLTCYMKHYTITADGQLVEDSGAEKWDDFTGTVDLDWSNVVASGPGTYTRDGEDAHYLEYRVVFVKGKVTEIVEVTNESHRAAKVKHRADEPLSEEDVQRHKQRQSESLVGRTMWLWWGGDETGYPVTVVAENNKQWIVQKDSDSDLEKLHRGDRDRLLFDSQGDGQRYKAERAAEWERERLEYEAAISSQQPTEAA